MTDTINRLLKFTEMDTDRYLGNEVPDVQISTYPVYSTMYWRVIASNKKNRISVMKSKPDFAEAINSAIDTYEKVLGMTFKTPDDISVNNRHHRVEYEPRKFVTFQTFGGVNHTTGFYEEDEDGFNICSKPREIDEFPKHEFIRHIDENTDLYSYNDIQLLSGTAGYIKVNKDKKVVAVNVTAMS